MTGQQFTFARWTWDITAAEAIIAATPRNTLDVEVRHLTRLLPLVRFDPDYAATVDLARPLILAPFPEEPSLLVPIDGWHRIARANTDGVASLPVWVLTVDEAAGICTERRP